MVLRKPEIRGSGNLLIRYHNNAIRSDTQHSAGGVFYLDITYILIIVKEKYRTNKAKISSRTNINGKTLDIPLPHLSKLQNAILQQQYQPGHDNRNSLHSFSIYILHSLIDVYYYLLLLFGPVSVLKSIELIEAGYFMHQDCW